MKNYAEPKACATCKHARMDSSLSGPSTTHLPRDHSRPFAMLCEADGVPIPPVPSMTWKGNDVPSEVVEAGRNRIAWFESHQVERHGLCDLWEGK